MSDPFREDGLYPMRLQRFLARAGVASRRGSERLMTAGRVQVNGVVVTELGSRVDPVADEVRVDGVVCTLSDASSYLMLNKPAGVLTTMRDPQGRRCVSELMPCADHPGLYPVGRLDKDTTGLLLFTSDGNLGQRLLHPSHHVEKTYLARVEGQISDAALKQLACGIELDDGMTAPAQARLIKPADARTKVLGIVASSQITSVVELTIHEGRKHQVKRMLEAVGHPVLRLHREQFGPLKLGTLKPGAWRELTPQEIQLITSTTSD